MQPGSKRRKAKEGLRIRPAEPRRSWRPRNRLRTPESTARALILDKDSSPRSVLGKGVAAQQRPPAQAATATAVVIRRSTPGQSAVRQVPDHLRVPGGGHPQKRLRTEGLRIESPPDKKLWILSVIRTKTPPREVRWERGLRRSGDRQHKPRRLSRNDADAHLAKSSQECKRRGRPPKKEASNNRKRCEQSAGSEDPDIWSPTLCPEDALFFQSGVVDVDTGGEEELHKDGVAAVRPKRAAPQARDETEVTIQMIKKILEFRGHRSPAGKQRCYARRAVFERLEELFLQAQKLVGEKIWRGQVLHYISELATELETSTRSHLYQNASFWKGALLLLLKHLGAPKEEVQKLRQRYYLTAGRVSQTTALRLSTALAWGSRKDLSHYYAKCKPFHSMDFEVAPSPPCLLRPDRPRMKVTRTKTETEDGDAPPKSLRSWMRYSIVREDNSAHPFRTAKYATVRHCVLEACKDTGFEPESFLCLCENEAVSLDAEKPGLTSDWQSPVAGAQSVAASLVCLLAEHCKANGSELLQSSRVHRS
eukprot:s4269_g3.t1